MYAPVCKVGPIELWPNRCAMARDQPFRFGAAEYHASNGVNCIDSGIQAALFYVFSAPSQSSARAGCAKEIISATLEYTGYLAHRLMVRPGIICIRILVRPECITHASAEVVNAVNASL